MKQTELFQEYADGNLVDAESGNTYFVGNDLYIKGIKVCKVDRSAKTFQFFDRDTIQKKTRFAIWFALVEAGFNPLTNP